MVAFTEGSWGRSHHRSQAVWVSVCVCWGREHVPGAEEIPRAGGFLPWLRPGLGPMEFVALPRGKLYLEGQTAVDPCGPRQALSCEEVDSRTREEIKVKILTSPDRTIQNPFAGRAMSLPVVIRRQVGGACQDRAAARGRLSVCPCRVCGGRPSQWV